MHRVRSKQELEVKLHSLGLLRQRISGSESAQLADAATATQAELEQAKADAESAKQKKADMIKSAKVCCVSADNSCHDIHRICWQCAYKLSKGRQQCLILAHALHPTGMATCVTVMV